MVEEMKVTQQGGSLRGLILNGVNFGTQKYDSYVDDPEKDLTEVRRKTVNIYISDPKIIDAIKALNLSQLKVYDNTKSIKEHPDEDIELVHYLKMSFSKDTTVYNLDKMTKTKIQITDENYPNFRVNDANVAISFNKNFYNKEKLMIRLSSYQYHQDNVVLYQVDFFGDDSKFTEVANAEIVSPKNNDEQEFLDKPEK